jgi:glycosyltransferase involved in cell wall biosynthesis
LTPAAPASLAVTQPPLVSVLLASRNGSRYLEESLASLAAQTYPEIEIVAVDDGSTDRTPEVLSSFAASHPRTRVLRTQGIGLAGSLALAATHATGSYLARQDDDDRSHPERIEQQVVALEWNTDLAVLGTQASMIDAHGDRIRAYPAPTDREVIRRTLRRATPFVHGSVMMRKAAYEAAGGYRAPFRASQDYDLWLRMGEGAGLANLAEPLYEWRLHPSGVFTRARRDQLFYSAVARAFADERRVTGGDSCTLLESCSDPQKFLDRYPLAGTLAFYLGEVHAREGLARDARRHLARALSDPGSRARALPWWILTWALPLTARGRRAGHAARASAFPVSPSE